MDMFGSHNRNDSGIIDETRDSFNSDENYFDKLEAQNVARAFRYLKFLLEEKEGHPITHFEGRSVKDIDNFITKKIMVT